MPYSSNTNAVLLAGCDTLRNLTVRLETAADISTVGGGGWTLQVNCFAAPGQSCQTSTVNWLQYIIYVWNGVLQWQIQYWAVGASDPWPPYYSPEPGTTPWLPCWSTDFTLQRFAKGLSGDTLPGGSALEVALATDSAGGVRQAAFIYQEADGNRQAALFDLPVTLSISSFEVNLVGIAAPPDNGYATFADSLPNAVIRYTVSAGELSVRDGKPVCGEFYTPTDEESNMGYSDVDGAPGTTVTQTLQPIPPTVTPSTLTFPVQHLGTSSPQQTVTVGTAGLGVRITSLSFVNNPPWDSNQFLAILEDGPLVVSVWYQPTLEGAHNAKLQIAHNAPGSPLIVELFGVGDATPVPLLSASPQSLLFTTSKTTNHVVTLTNTGSAPLTITSIAIDGSSSFTYGSTCNVGPGGGTLNPGQQCTITGAYHGTTAAKAVLLITHNAAGSPTMIDLEAIGKGPEQ